MANDLVVQMKNILDEYNADVQRVTEAAINTVAKESVDKLKNTSPVGYTGEYAKGWTVKKDGKLTQTVHNKKYQLTHLLENGHVIRNARGTYGRAPAHPHIKPVEEWASAELETEIMRGL